MTKPLGLAFGPRNGAKAEFRGKQLDELAQALGMSADELKAELQQGKKIADIAQEKGLTADQLRQKSLDARIQAIQQAVKDGKISQEKADEMIKSSRTRHSIGVLGASARPLLNKPSDQKHYSQPTEKASKNLAFSYLCSFPAAPQTSPRIRFLPLPPLRWLNYSKKEGAPFQSAQLSFCFQLIATT